MDSVNQQSPCEHQHLEWIEGPGLGQRCKDCGATDFPASAVLPEMLANKNREGTLHAEPHARTLACSAPPKCKRADPAQGVKRWPEELDFPDLPFTFFDEPGEHDPCYIVMPGGNSLPVNHHGTPGVDIARAKFIIAACNAQAANYPVKRYDFKPHPTEILSLDFRECVNGKYALYSDYAKLSAGKIAAEAELERVKQERDSLRGVINNTKDFWKVRAEAAETRCTSMREALERTLRNFQLLLERKPVRDVEETIAEALAAIAGGKQS